MPIRQVRLLPHAAGMNHGHHVEVRIEAAHPQDVGFLFERSAGRTPGAAVLSGALHLLVVAFLVLGVRFASSTSPRPERDVHPAPPGIVWLMEAGAGGGGGGGGNHGTGPIRRAELPGRDRLTVPVAKPQPPVLTPPTNVTPPPAAAPSIAQLDIAALPLASGTEASPGTLDGVPGATSLGPGAGRGAGAGNGDGIGDGTGNGLGDGRDRGYGGGAPGPGAGAQAPIVIYGPRPDYTAEAMRAKIQGVAVVECTVMPDGTVRNPRIARSLDARFGLDEQALKTASRWRFIPARWRGQPVPMLIAIQLSFAIH